MSTRATGGGKTTAPRSGARSTPVTYLLVVWGTLYTNEDSSVRYNPYYNPSYKHVPGGLPHVPASQTASCHLIYNDDGTIATGPTGERFCFSAEKAQMIVDRLGKAKKAVAAADAAEAKAPRAGKVIKDTGHAVLPCKDGRISVSDNGDIMFVAKNGHHHGILLYGVRDPDYLFVKALDGYIRQLHRNGTLRSMVGLQILDLTPPGFIGPRGTRGAPKPFYA